MKKVIQLFSLKDLLWFAPEEVDLSVERLIS